MKKIITCIAILLTGCVQNQNDLMNERIKLVIEKQIKYSSKERALAHAYNEIAIARNCLTKEEMDSLITLTNEVLSSLEELSNAYNSLK